MIYLYIKQHTVTKLKYFGRTERDDLFKYKGSGRYWNRHINKHGREYIQTLKIFEFDNQEECTEFALKFSKDNDIVESREWANLKEENGLDGRSCGYKHTEETKRIISEKNTNKERSLESRQKYRDYALNSRTDDHKNKITKHNRNPTEEHKKNISVGLTNPTQEIRTRRSSAATGKKHTEETKKKISEKAKARPPFSEQHRKNISLANSVKRGPMAEERKRNISLAKRGKPANMTGVFKTAEKNKGKKRTDEQKKKISDALKGKPKSPEHIENLRKAKIKLS